LVAVSGWAQKVKVGDPYLGGIVAYLIQPGEPGYEKKHPHGLLAAKEDVGKLVKWQEAIKLAKEYRAGDFDDWRMPVKEDLIKLFNNKDLIGGFQIGNYWTSQLSKEDEKGAYLINFYNGYTYTEYMETAVYARFVRKF
ncbi:MAG: DUF1566 domain-containing protein, partial [Sediminibacterium sp.]|nr:DUF1566 domain-containing protein [Sediminibacterium sp.]